MYIIANLAIGGNWPGSPNSSTVFPALYQIDYIRAYQADTDAGGAPGTGGSTSNAAAGSGVSGSANQNTGGTAATPAAANAGGDSGCSCATPRSNKSSGVVALLYVAIGVLINRRRHRDFTLVRALAKPGRAIAVPGATTRF